MRREIVLFVLGAAFAINAQGLVEDAVGRDRVLAYVNDARSWTRSAVTAPIHAVAIVACLAALACGGKRRR